MKWRMHTGTWEIHTASFHIAVSRHAKGHAQGGWWHSTSTYSEVILERLVHSQGDWLRHTGLDEDAMCPQLPYGSQMTTISQYRCLATLFQVTQIELIPPKPVWQPEREMNQQKWQDCWLLVSPSFPREPLAYFKMNGLYSHLFHISFLFWD